MDEVVRAFDDIMVERLWRTVKYEDIYIQDYKTPVEVYNLDNGNDIDRMKTDGMCVVVDLTLASVAQSQQGIKRKHFPP